MNKIIATIGVSCSGKTTWAKNYMKQNSNTYYVSRDEERKSIFGEYRMGSSKEEGIITAIIKDKVSYLLQMGDVVIDNTHLKQKYIDSLINSFPNTDIEWIVIADFEDKEELIKRNQKRYFDTGKLVPENTLHNQLNQFEELNIPSDIKLNGKKTDPRITNRYEKGFGLPDCVIVDLDGSLSMMNGRSPYEGEKCAEDLLNTSLAKIINNYDIPVFIFSGRNSDNGGLESTISWLDRMGIEYDSLCMRDEGDNRPDTVIKKQMFNEMIKGKYNPVCVFDDRDCMVDMWRNMGIQTYQCYYGNF